ncbi:hypothetical protein KIN20_027387, partial [Parelaphostrongylus tenuis]
YNDPREASRDLSLAQNDDESNQLLCFDLEEDSFILLLTCATYVDGFIVHCHLGSSSSARNTTESVENNRHRHREHNHIQRDHTFPRHDLEKKRDDDRDKRQQRLT